MNELALFAGGGGGLLAGKLLGWKTVCYVEREWYCVEIIKARIRDGYLDNAPIWSDVRTFDGKPWRGCVDIVTAGFPCQPFSAAGEQRGEDDERNCWPDTARILREVRPRYALLENVPALLTSGYFGTVLGDLAEIGFNARWGVLSAAGQGAPHLRKRVWVVANAELKRARSEGEPAGRQERETANTCKSAAIRQGNGATLPKRADASGSDQGEIPNAESLQRQAIIGNEQNRNVSGDGEVGDPSGKRELQPQGSEQGKRGWTCDTSWWDVEPNVGRVANGVASRVDRLKALGNGQVPAVARAAWLTLQEDV